VCVDVETRGAQPGKIGIGVTDSRDRLHALPAKIGEFATRPVDHVDRPPRSEPRADGPRPQAGRGVVARAAAIRHDDRIDRGETATRLAQRTRWQQMPVAQASRSIDHDDLVLTSEPKVLQAIIAHHDLRAGGHRRAGCGRPIAVDEHELGAPMRMQDGLVAGDRWIGVPGHPERPSVVPSAVATQDDRGHESTRA